ncbi:hypothetical protein GCM10022286_23840 [Gryllotalpicola daejeonensis]|uniref:QacE family quaternary ammonium compound efflux SMR transporter n=1 Tax=Gryllotalpicola daejeonensis TaxID=993087 RepID=A0ABP7ZLS2_9MICO
MTRWLLLAGTIVFEVAGSLSLEGAIEHPWLYAVVAVAYVLSFWLFGRVLRAGMPVGMAYAIWGAIGVALTAALADLIFDEELTTLTIIGMVIVIAGVVLINVGGGHAGAQATGEPSSARPHGSAPTASPTPLDASRDGRPSEGAP